MDINRKLSEIRRIEELSSRDSFIHRIHSLIMLLLTLFYVIVLMTFNRYELTAMMMMFLYPVFMFRLSDLSFSESIRKLRYLLPLIFLMGIFDLIFDRTVLVRAGTFYITRGMISFFNLLIKGFLSVEASYILIATHSVYDICSSLALLHLPRIFISLFLLTYRYIQIMVEEVSCMMEAYSLRAPKQKGLHISSWGSFLGQLLLRTFDRASELYSGMIARGYDGDLRSHSSHIPVASDYFFFIILVTLILLCRLFNIPVAIGDLVRRHI